MLTEPTAQPALNLRWTLSNALSALRMVLAVPAAYALYNDERAITIALAITGVITDVLDGYVARKRNEISDLGKILDPLADKVFVGAAVVLLLIKGWLPLWYVLVVVGRDLLILVGGLLVERRTGQVLPSNYPGKGAVLVLSVTIMLIIGGVDRSITDILLGVALLLLAVSLTLYTVRAVKLLK